MCLSEAFFQAPATESPGLAPVHSAQFATIPVGRHISAETEATQTLVVLKLQ